MGKRAVGMPRERHKTLLRALGRLQRNRHMAEPSPRRLFKELLHAFSTTSLSTVLRRAAGWHQRHNDAHGFHWKPRRATSFLCKHAEVFSRGFLDFKGGQRQREREQPTFIPIRRALAAPPARAAGLLPLQESRASLLLPTVHDRVPAPSVPTDAAAPQSVLPSLQFTVLPLGSVQATLVIQQRQPQPCTGDIPSCVLSPRPEAVPLHLHR